MRFLNNSLFFTFIYCGLISTSAALEAEPAADIVIKNAKIYTVNSNRTWVEAIAIKDGKYQFAGSNNRADDFIGDHTQVLNLNGKMIMPGINDAHMHTARGGMKSLYQCNFPFSANPGEVQDAVVRCIEDMPEASWIIGGQWDSSFFDRFNIVSPKAFLDEVSGDKAVFLADDSNHNGWANSKALALAGITKNSKNPSDGTIVRDPKTGEPNGLLLEGAKIAFYEGLPTANATQHRTGALQAVKMANQFGITGIKDASADEPTIAVYQSLDKNKQLSVYMATAIRAPYGHRVNVLDYRDIDRIRDTYKSQHVFTDFVKIVMDGVPTSSRTAAMLDDYQLQVGESEATSGNLHLSPTLLTQDMIELDKRGYTIKVHTAGDNAVKVTLDAIEAVRNKNGKSGLRHELANAGYIASEDIPRFNQLNAVADLSPYIWYPSLIIDSIVNEVAEKRAQDYFPIKSLIKAKAPLLAGSDWPAAVETMDPWLGIESMITREDPKALVKGTLWKEQSISLEQALRIFTLDGAKALKLGDVTGSIEAGKSADFIIINQNLFDISPHEISETKVEFTYFEGKVVFERTALKVGI